MPKGVKNVKAPVTETPDDGLLVVPSTQDVPVELSPETAGEENGTSVTAIDGADPSVLSARQAGKTELVAANVAVAAGLIDLFIAWASSDEEQDLEPYVGLGLLNEDHSLTDQGCAVLDSAAVAWRTINFLTLGTPITFEVESGKATVQAGSMLRIVHNGRDKDGSVFSVCDVGQFLPEGLIYKNHLHIYTDARYPLAQPLTTNYETAS